MTQQKSFRLPCKRLWGFRTYRQSALRGQIRL